jgi:hypothetical protein
MKMMIPLVHTRMSLIRQDLLVRLISMLILDKNESDEEYSDELEGDKGKS